MSLTLCLTVYVCLSNRDTTEIQLSGDLKHIECNIFSVTVGLIIICVQKYNNTHILLNIFHYSFHLKIVIWNTCPILLIQNTTTDTTYEYNTHPTYLFCEKKNNSTVATAGHHFTLLIPQYHSC